MSSCDIIICINTKMHDSVCSAIAIGITIYRWPCTHHLEPNYFTHERLVAYVRSCTSNGGIMQLVIMWGWLLEKAAVCTMQHTTL